MDRKRIRQAVKTILKAVGENPEREGLKDTPERVARMYEEILSGYSQNAAKELQVYYEQKKYEQIILVRDIPLFSMCEHHMMPFFGRAHVAYIPSNNRILGLSKIARVVDVYAKRLQIQEKLTTQIADVIMSSLKPQGVLVVIEAEHFCMVMRGVKKPGSKVVTSSVRGIFRKDARTRSEALALIKG